jgi:hypothetical protein
LPSLALKKINIMGAWGYGHFEDDTAFDFMMEVEESDNPKKTLSDALNSAIDIVYLEYAEANAVLVSAAYIDRQINGTKFSSPDSEEPLEVDTFPDRYPDRNFIDLKEKAIKALHQVLSENCELNELWAENEDDYPMWRQGIEELIERLQKH